MARKARQRGLTGIYHCIIRGIDKQDIFLDNQDRKKFLKEMVNTKQQYEYKLYAYCLMDNHVHLMLEDTKNKLDKIMQSITIRYSSYFNKKYDRVGHLFQNRYLSKVVDNERYLLVLQRYIHQNPPNMQTYRWSSYGEYIYEANIVDIKFILNKFGNNKNNSIEEFIKFTAKKKVKYNAEEMKQFEMEKSLPDSAVISIIKEATGIENVLKIKEYCKEIRDEHIRKLLRIKGISQIQLARILGVDKKIVQRAGKNLSPMGQSDPLRNVPNGSKEEKDG